MGAQDDFEYALDFVKDGSLQTPDMIWDPSFQTWANFEVRFNSQMMLMSSDLTTGTGLFYGFGPEEREEVLEAIPILG